METRNKRKAPNFLQKLHMREVNGKFQQHLRDKLWPIFTKVPERNVFRLRHLVSSSVLLAGHVFLGLTKNGQYIVSYSMEEDGFDSLAQLVYSYYLHWWRFAPFRPLKQVSTIRLFGDHKIYQTLYIALCEWPLDSSKVFIYGSCVPNLKGPQPQYCYITVTAIPPIKRCSDCVAYLGNTDDSQGVPSEQFATCLRHSFAVHTRYQVLPPYPRLPLRTVLQNNGCVVIHMGHSLASLSVQLTTSCSKKAAVTQMTPNDLRFHTVQRRLNSKDVVSSDDSVKENISPEDCEVALKDQEKDLLLNCCAKEGSVEKTEGVISSPPPPPPPPAPQGGGVTNVTNNLKNKRFPHPPSFEVLDSRFQNVESEFDSYSCSTYTAWYYVQDLERDRTEESINNTDGDLDGVGYHHILPVEVKGAESMMLQPCSKNVLSRAVGPIIQVQQMTFDLEQCIHEVSEKLCVDCGMVYSALKDYDVRVIDVCTETGDVTAMARIVVCIMDNSTIKHNSNRTFISNNVQRSYVANFKFVWKRETGKYLIVDADEMQEVSQNELHPNDGQKWFQHERECQDLRTMWKTPQDFFNSVNVMTNEAIFKGTSKPFLLHPRDYVAIVL